MVLVSYRIPEMGTSNAHGCLRLKYNPGILKAVNNVLEWRMAGHDLRKSEQVHISLDE